MRGQGRYLQFRHAFPEVFGPGIQLRRGLVRLRWALLGSVDFRPIWTLGVSAGLLGVLLTMALFVVPPDGRGAAALAATVPQPAPSTVLHPPAAPSSIPTYAPPQSLPAWPNWPQMDPTDRPLEVKLLRTVLPYGWDDRRMALAVSRPNRLPLDAMPQASSSPGWSTARLPLWPSTPVFVPYREPAGLRMLQPITPRVAVSPSARGAQNILKAVQPSLRIETRIAPLADRPQVLKYELIVTNVTPQPVPDANVYASLDVLRVGDVTPDALVEPSGLRWRLGGVAPGQEQRMSFCYSTRDLFEANVVSDVEIADRVATLVQVDQDTPFFERPPPATDAPKFPAGSQLPPFPDFNSSAPPANAPAPRSSIPSGASTPRSSIPPGGAVPQGSNPPRTMPPAQPRPVTPPRQPAGQPILQLRSTPPIDARVGSDAITWYEISNVGAAAAENVVLTVRLPEGMTHHDGGGTVRHCIARIEPNETRKARLVTRIDAAGTHPLDSELTCGSQSQRQLVQLTVTATGDPGETSMLSHWQPPRNNGIIQAEMLSLPRETAPADSLPSGPPADSIEDPTPGWRNWQTR